MPLLVPDNLSVSYTDLDSDDSGRDESGFMHRIVLRRKVAVWSFEYTYLTQAEKDYMERVFSDAYDVFDFVRPYKKGTIETKAYCSNYGIAWHNAKEGKWKNYKFNIIEC